MRPTLHGRHGVCVDYYRSVTGPTRVEVIDDPRNPGTPLRVLRVDGLIDLITCCDCWADPAVRSRLEEARRTGEIPGA